MPMISVIVPVYKVEPYIHRCVDSILGQSFSDFELILVDDGSPDNCGAICDAYAAKDSRIHVIHQENGGLSAARNAGIDWMFANSDSEWVTFVDSDDWIHEAYLQRLLKAAKQHDCMLSACYVFHTSGEDFTKEDDSAVRLLSADDFYCGSVPSGMNVIACGKLYARSLFARQRYPVGRLHEDEFVTYKMIYASGQVAVVSSALYAYYRNEEGIIRSGWSPKRMDAMDAMDEQLAFARQTGNARLFDRCSETRAWLVLDYLWKIREMEEKSDAIRQCRQMLREDLADILRDKKNRGKYPFNLENFWIYEEAYPNLYIWDLMRRIFRCIKRMKKKQV